MECWELADGSDGGREGKKVSLHFLFEKVKHFLLVTEVTFRVRCRHGINYLEQSLCQTKRGERSRETTYEAQRTVIESGFSLCVSGNSMHRQLYHGKIKLSAQERANHF